MARKSENKQKPLEKMTATELRSLAKDIPKITGVHGMNKTELLSEIKKARGIEEKPGKGKNSSVREVKKKIKLLKIERETALKDNDKKTALICKRRISRLKKKTRRVA